MRGAAKRSIDGEGVPNVVPGWESKATELSPEEGFLLSRIDGVTSWRTLRGISGIPPEAADRHLERWISDGLVVMDRTGSGLGGPPRLEIPAARTVIPEAGRTPGAVDPALDIPVELQQRILDFELHLDRPYHEILGVARDADDRSIKRAYFRLSRDFHPDRYFRKQIGGFEPRLDRIFKKVALAYELLRDPATRAELERSYAALPPQPESPAPGPQPAPQKLGKQEWLARMRRQFRIPEELLVERRFKARQFGEAARVALHQRRWNEAASCIRLAIAFDPWADAYKECFAEIQAEVNQLRAVELLEEAGGAWDSRSRDQALALYEEALHYRPSDPDIHDRAARVALELEDTERALEYAERACELAPEVAGYHLTLGCVRRAEGTFRLAQEAFEKARSLDPKDPRAEQELRRIRRRLVRSSGGKR
jgi:curved DNA-binding protein CbpA